MKNQFTFVLAALSIGFSPFSAHAATAPVQIPAVCSPYSSFGYVTDIEAILVSASQGMAEDTLALEQDRRACVAWTLKQGANPNGLPPSKDDLSNPLVNELSFYPLTFAAKKNDIDSVRLLLAHKVNVNQQEPNGMTALYWAAYYHESDILQLLLSNKADPNLQPKTLPSPLDLAVDNGDAISVDALIAVHADINHVDPITNNAPLDTTTISLQEINYGLQCIQAASTPDDKSDKAMDLIDLFPYTQATMIKALQRPAPTVDQLKSGFTQINASLKKVGAVCVTANCLGQNPPIQPCSIPTPDPGISSNTD